MSNAEEEAKALVDLGRSVMERAIEGGADVAEAGVHSGSHLSVKVRMSEPELVEEAGSRALGLRVMVGQRVASTYTSDLSEAGQRTLIEDALELARLSESDEFAGPPDPSELSSPTQWADLDTFDEGVSEISADEALSRAQHGERAAFDFDPRITNSEGASFTRARGVSALVTSGGFAGSDYGTYASLVVNPVADDEGGKKRSGYHWSASRHYADLEDSQAVGEEAARRTIAQLGAKKLPTQELPVIFDKDAARSILGLFAGCVLGSSIWRKSSYLVDRVGTRVASDLVDIVDDPLLPRAPGSRAFDGEGLLCCRNVVVEGGVLKTYLMDTYSARKLGQTSTGSASRSPAGGISPSTSNLILKANAQSRDELIAETKHGLYVTSMMGFGFNAVTGDFSRGASGFLIQNGELSDPVSEVTISLNLDQLLQRIDAVADDLDQRTAIASPTFRVSSMTLAGS
ncbi:MAG: TldD/PmbA family protein [Deltaproteobacteria bacterium]|nr:TldD/PmbA family protein [Deltaproteobacteria bacterium]MBW1875512.1 TldD/PmbA family protein [Deltaproteobacteria bacterium]MBW2210881.1 TldD/PmbA family protein [Deltaproteobacteria bacterium]MBW2214254.1 TldD/PmbA family protein [Deltaproteobacteria bacterium]MBW2379716.1 TldD/PmbA family protein [Deltaproteobacteria bacterium]